MWISREKYESAIELAKMESQEVERKKLHNRLADYEAREMASNDNLNKANAQIKELQGKIRDQSKSDMLYEAIQVILAAIKPEATTEQVKIKYDSLGALQRAALMTQSNYQAQSQGYSSLRGIGNLFGF